MTASTARSISLTAAETAGPRLPKGAVALHTDSLQELQEILKNHHEVDSYNISPVYMAYTGRHGLWHYGDRNSFLLLAQHPNHAKRILIFPPYGPLGKEILFSFLEECAPEGYEYSIARLLPPAADTLCAELNTVLPSHLHAEEVQEDMLDWLYPAHMLDNEATTKLEGRRYEVIRNRLNQIKPEELRIEPLNFLKHWPLLGDLVLDRWQSMIDSGKLTEEDVLSPYRKLAELASNPQNQVLSEVFFFRESVAAVNFYELPNSSGTPANVFGPVCNTTIKGLSETVIVRMCSDLASRGIQYVNLGGSETSGLNQYKLKYRPAANIELKTIKLHFHMALSAKAIERAREKA